MNKLYKSKMIGIVLSTFILVGVLGTGCNSSGISSGNSQENTITDVLKRISNQDNEETTKGITIEQFKNSYFAYDVDDCTIEDVFSCPDIGDSEVKHYKKIAPDEFEIKYDKLAFIFKCDGEKSSLVKYINRNNEEDNQEHIDRECLDEIYGQLYDCYNNYNSYYYNEDYSDYN